MNIGCTCERMQEHIEDMNNFYHEFYDLLTIINYNEYGSSITDYCIDIFEFRENDEIGGTRKIHLDYVDLEKLITALDRMTAATDMDQCLFTDGGNLRLEWCVATAKFRIATVGAIIYMLKHEAEELIRYIRFDIPEMIEARQRHQM